MDAILYGQKGRLDNLTITTAPGHDFTHVDPTVGKPFPPDLKLKTLTIHVAMFWKFGRHWREQMHNPGYCNTTRMAVLRAPPRKLHEVVPKSLCQLTLEGEIRSTEASTLL